MMDGIINVYKEKGYTSHDVVAKMRGILKMKKIGHTGTLDPAAEGVLPVCLGKGTKLCDMLTDKTKTYQAVMLLGQETDTQDTTGQILAEYPVSVTEEEVREAVLSFLGPYMQVPPMYSALKVNGKKLYELARAGKEVERQARLVEILEISVDQIDLPRVTMTVSCSKGTYIRTLCYDIGRKLGCGGCMESLLRTRVDRFTLEDSLRLSEIEALRDQGKVEEHVLPVDSVFWQLPELWTKGDGDKLVHNGNALPAEAELFTVPPVLWERVRVYDSQGQFIGIYGYDERKKRFQPQKIFLGGN
ncbi:MAG: tRNA pseudouridine(55) synthase TruB [Brotaphodocola sp.]